MRVTRVLVLLPASPDHPFTNSLHPSHASILHTPLTHLFPPPSLRPMLSHGLLTPLFSDSLLPLSPSLPVSTSPLPFPILSRLFSSPLLWGLSFTLSHSRFPSLSPRCPLVVHNPSDANGPHLEVAFPYNPPEWHDATSGPVHVLKAGCVCLKLQPLSPQMTGDGAWI